MLVVNPLTEAMVSPYARCVRVVTAGHGPGPVPLAARPKAADGRPRARQDAPLRRAGRRVDEGVPRAPRGVPRCSGSARQDFELVATADPPGPVDEFTRFVGWQSQEELPAPTPRGRHPGRCRRSPRRRWAAPPSRRWPRAGRWSPAGSAACRSRSPTAPPGCSSSRATPATWRARSRPCSTTPALRERMGLAGRQRFEEHYAWDVIIERHYRPLLKRTGAGPPVPGLAYTPFIPDRVDHEALVAARGGVLRPGAVPGRGRAAGPTGRSMRRRATRVPWASSRPSASRRRSSSACALSVYRPRTIVEVGTQHGKSTRRILDMVAPARPRQPASSASTRPTRCVTSALTRRSWSCGDVTGRFRAAVMTARE